MSVTKGFRHGWIQGLRVLFTISLPTSHIPWFGLVPNQTFPKWRQSWPPAALHEQLQWKGSTSSQQKSQGWFLLADSLGYWSRKAGGISPTQPRGLRAEKGSSVGGRGG